MILEIARISDDVEFEVHQIGCWQHARLKSGEGFWEFTGAYQWTTSNPKPTKEFLIRMYRLISLRKSVLL